MWRADREPEAPPHWAPSWVAAASCHNALQSARGSHCGTGHYVTCVQLFRTALTRSQGGNRTRGAEGYHWQHARRHGTEKPSSSMAHA